MALAGPVRDAFMLQAARSGRAGAGESFGMRGWRPPCGKRGGGRLRRGGGMRLAFPPCGICDGIYGGGVAVPARGHEGDQVAAVVDDVAAELDPGLFIQLVGLDAEVEADVVENSGDRAATVLGGNIIEGGRAGEEPVPGRVVQAVSSFAAMRRACGRGADAGTQLEIAAVGGAVAEPFLERGGAKQATGDAVEDQWETADVEGCGDVGEAGEKLRLGDVQLQGGGKIAAVGDEGVDEAEEQADATRNGPLAFGGEGFDREGGRVGHCVGI